MEIEQKRREFIGLRLISELNSPLEMIGWQDTFMAKVLPLDRIRSLCLELPGTSEKISHGMPTFFAGKKVFVNWVDSHHNDGIVGIWCAAPAGVQEALIDEEPDRFFRPPYVGVRGWLGVRLAGAKQSDIDWDETANIVLDAYRCVATPKLLKELAAADHDQ
jgi:hypothetical protein